MFFYSVFIFIVLSFVDHAVALPEKFGVFDASEPSSKTNFLYHAAISHRYDTRSWLGQPVNSVCRMLDMINDILFISADSCVPHRVLKAMENPVIIIPSDPPEDGCFKADPPSDTPDNVIPFHMFGYGISELIPGMITQGFRWDNTVVIHVCDEKSFCGTAGVEAAIESLHSLYVTTLQCWIHMPQRSDFNSLFSECLDLVSLLPNNDRRLLIVAHTAYTIIPQSINLMSQKLILNLLSEVVFVLPPNYEISIEDFLQIKDQDIIRVVRWRAEAWLASVTQRTVSRWLDFWGYNPNVTQIEDTYKDTIAGLLTTISKSSFYSHMINAKPVPDSHRVCSVHPNPESQVAAAEVAKLLSCVDSVGWDVCSSFAVTGYSIDPNDNLPRAHSIGLWNSSGGYSNFGYRTVDDLYGRTLRVASIRVRPFLERNESAHENAYGNESRLYFGVIPNMLDTLSRVLNFKYEFVFPEPGDEFYGVKLENGSWNGMIGMLERNEVDMIASDLTVTAERQEVVDYTAPYFEDSITIMLPRSEFDKSIFTFLLPFSPKVWACVIGAVALSGPLLYFFSRMSPYYSLEGKPNHFASLSESYMYCYGAIVSQGGQITPDADSSRIFMAFWWLFGICAVATYSGNLIAFLTFPGKLQFIDNFDDFVYTSGIPPVIERNSYISSTLKHSDRPSYREIWSRIEKNPEASLVDSYREAINKVANNKYGFISQMANLKVTIAIDSERDGPCRFAFLRHPIEKVKYGLAFRKGTNYAPLFDKWVQRLCFSGLISHWMDQEWQGNYKPKRCQQQLESAPDEIRKVKIADVVGVYVFLGVGYTLAVLLFMAERLTMKPQHRFCAAFRNFFDKRQPRSATFDLNVVTLNNGMVIRSKA